MSEWLEIAIDFLEKTDLTNLPLGRTAVKFEIHKRYMDIQIDVEGTEIIQIGLDNGEVQDAYDEETDFGTVSCGKSASCVLGPGRFIVCMGEEPHKPSIAENEDLYLKKCVIKVAV